MPFLYSILLGFILLWNQSIYSWDAPVYKIVIDPGHGGNNQNPYEEYGDKYDTISGKFLEKYKPGTSYKGRTEREIVLELSKEVTQILELTKTKEGFEKFRKIAAKFTKSEITPIQFNILMTRTDDYTSLKPANGLDENYKYRLYDFPDKKTGKKILGRMSVINKFQPYLVVSIHLNPSYPGHPGGMAAVIAPPYRVFQQLRLISNGKGKASNFTNSAYGNWLQFVSNWNHLENAMTDTWIYFNGYWSDRSGKKTDINKFAGYRQNMVTWKYSDPIGWEEQAKRGGRGAYAKSHDDFIARGKFWNRERGQAETWRRDYGREGFGGDNLYASNELLRFVQYGLRNNVRDEKGKPPILGPIQPPYISTYSLPTYINAICAFLEIGYIDNDRDMKYIHGHKKEVAESLAVGIYSLFRGIKPIYKKGFPYSPKGKQVNFKRYENYEGKNYFKTVSE